MSMLRDVTKHWLKKCNLFVVATVALLTVESRAVERIVTTTAELNSSLKTALEIDNSNDTIKLLSDIALELTFAEITDANSIKAKSITFIGSLQDPDSFSKLNITKFPTYLTELFDVYFEKLIISSNISAVEKLSNGQGTNIRSFKNCVIKDCKQDYFIELKGNISPILTFENCLFVNNKKIIYINFWNPGYPKLTIKNCTFVNNDSVLVKSSGNFTPNTDSILITNCIFDNSSIHNIISSKITTNSFIPTEEDQPWFAGNADTNSASHWIPLGLSGAKEIGDAATAPEKDIAGKIRGTVIDAGCWIGEPGGVPEIENEPVNIIKEKGSSAQFSVEVIGGKPFTYSWYKVVDESEDVLVYSSLDVTGYINHLIWEEVTFADEGKYYCIIKNASGSTTSDTANLTVIDMPKINTIEITPNKSSYFVGDKVTFKVKATGGNLTYQWFLYDDALAGEINDALTTEEFVSGHDGSIYKCVVTNTVGSDTAEFPITVVDNAPHITVSPENKTVIINETNTFEVKATGKDLVYQWYKDGIPIDTATNSIYTFMASSESFSGQYFCSVSNDLDTVNSDTVELVVNDNTKPFNSVKLYSGTFINRSKVSFVVNGLSLISTNSTDPIYADSIGIWYKLGSFPTESNEQNLVKFSINELIENDSLCTLSVIEKSDTCFSYYFVGSIFWHTANGDSVVPFDASKGDSIYMCSTEQIANTLKINSEYVLASDSIIIKISEFNSIDKNLISTLELWCDNNGKRFFKKDILSSLFPSADDTSLVFKNELLLKSDTTKVTWKLFLTGTLGNVSDTCTDTVVVGIPRPKNNITPKINDDQITTTSIKLSLESPIAGNDYERIRVWYGTTEIPLTDSPSKETYKFIDLSSDDLDVTINSLTENTLYYYGVQVFRDNYWSNITATSSGFVSTLKDVDPDRVDNSITITQASFNKETNTVSVSLIIDTVGIGEYLMENNLEVGMNWDLTAFPKLAPSLTDSVFDVTSDTMSYEFSLGQNMYFDTLYYVSSWLRIKDKSWSLFSEKASDTIRITPIEKQSFAFDQSLTDTVNTFDHNVYVWMDPNLLGSEKIDFTLTKFAPNSIPNTLIPVSTGVEFVNKIGSVKFNFGIKCDSIPSGYSISDVNIYQYDSLGKWGVIRNTSVDTINNILSLYMRPDEIKVPFILMIDTSKPVVTIASTTDTATALNAMTNVEIALNVKDNISNVKVELWCGLGQEKLSIDTITQIKTGTDYVHDFKLVIPAEKITPDNGVRALLVISDGRFSDTINISRKVYRDETSDAITTVPMKWIPLVTTTDLYHKSIDSVLKDFHVDGVFNYDDKMFRIYRYALRPGETDNDWIEYSSEESIKSLFDLVPGRVLWIKTREEKTLRLGSGETVSLKDPYSIELKPNDWTDISLPFRFNVYLGDIFDSSKIDEDDLEAIEVYSWKEQTSNLSSELVFNTKIPEYDNINTVLTYDATIYTDRPSHQAYTVYNDLDKTIILKIPSEPIAMSKRLSNEVLAKTNSSKGWSVKVNAKTQDETLNSVICAYSQGEGKTYLKSGPGFSDVRVLVQNPDNNSLWGHVVNHELTDGGTAVPLVIENSSQSKQNVHLEIERGKLVPNNTKVVFVNPENKNGQYLSNMDINVDGGTSKNGWLLTGDSAFVASWYKQIVNTNFSLVKMFPNPCRGKLMVRFTVPYMNINEIKMSIYDQLGRRVWANNINKKLKPGLNVVQCDISSKESFAAGTYIFSIQAIDYKGRIVGTKRNRLTYIP